MRRKRILVVASVVLMLGGLAAVGVGVWPSGKSASAAGASDLSDLAPAAALTGAPVDGIISDPAEQIVFHIHAHLQIYVDGRQRLVPYGIGIVRPYQLAATSDGPFVNGGKAFYWLHTHDQTGIIHMEAPVQHTFTLGEFFDMWGQPLALDRVGPAQGAVTVLVDGAPVVGDPRAVPLKPYSVIQLDVGTVVPFQKYSFPSGY